MQSGSSLKNSLKIVEGRGVGYGVIHGIAIGCGALIEYVSAVDTNLALAEVPMGLARASELIDLGAVYVNGSRTQDDEYKVQNQDSIRIHLCPRRFFNIERSSGAIKKRVVRINEKYVIVDKPAGLPVHALVDNAKENLLEILSHELCEQLYITHRLDVETSGLIAFARSKKAQSYINDQIANRRVKRLYEADVEREIEPGTYRHFMEPSPKAPKIVSRERGGETWLECQLEVQTCIRQESGLFKLAILLATGRPQQIRAQLSYLGAAIVGDKSYGSTVETPCDPLTMAPTIGLRSSVLEIE